MLCYCARRALSVTALALLASVVWAAGQEPPIRESQSKEPQKMVAVHVFNSKGELVGPVHSPRLELSDSQWQERLTKEQFVILRNKGTERAFCGTLLDNKLEGVYACAGCGLPLFASDTKFDSGTGWPSFYRPVGGKNVVEKADLSHGMMRVEILCARCDGHLGHVFNDGPPPTGMRYCLNSESLTFTPLAELSKLADPAAENGVEFKTGDKQSAGDGRPMTATAVLAGGCFWCTEAAFEQLAGVIDVESGYTGGNPLTANYEHVSTGMTGHAEAIKITYDPSVINYGKLLGVFFDAHDPTQLNGQGDDLGTQYRSAIFIADEMQMRLAQAKLAELAASGRFDSPIVTTLEPLGEFYPAEAFHQNYARLNPFQPYIRHHSTPLVCKVRELHPELVREEKQ